MPEEITNFALVHNSGADHEGVTCDLTMTAQLAAVYHLIADTGIVHQNVTGPLDMTLTAEGQTLTIKIEINQCELNLTSVGQGGNAKIGSNQGKQQGFTQPPVSSKTQTQEKLWRISQTIARTLIKKLSLQ